MGADTNPALPQLALSVRQPSAWAIIHGGKVIENRSLGSIRAGKMDCRRIAIHAAVGLTEKEYRWSLHKLQELGVSCPLPADLPRSAIIGSVDVVDIVSASNSPWFSSRPGNHGLVLENPVPCEPIPAKGTLGYFEWEPSGELAPSKPWMRAYGAPNKDDQTLNLFDDLEPGFKTPPPKPWGED
jgi:hypothetical protein